MVLTYYPILIILHILHNWVYFDSSIVLVSFCHNETLIAIPLKRVIQN